MCPETPVRLTDTGKSCSDRVNIHCREYVWFCRNQDVSAGAVSQQYDIDGIEDLHEFDASEAMRWKKKLFLFYTVLRCEPKNKLLEVDFGEN